MDPSDDGSAVMWQRSNEFGKLWGCSTAVHLRSV
jgi:hypothetical protein